MNRNRIRAALLSAAVAASAVSLVGCGKTERWCELDRGDVVVENWHCEGGDPAFEWEPDHDKPKYKKKPNKTKKVSR